MNTHHQAIAAPQGADEADCGASWRRTSIALAAGVVAVVAIFFDAFAEMATIWTTSWNYQVCWLVIPISSYFVWLRRHRLARLRPTRSFVWIALALPFGLLWLISTAAHVSLGVHIAAVGMLQVLALVLLGPAVFRALLFPLLFMWMMVPFGDSLIAPLLDMTTVLTVEGLRLAGMVVHSDGNLLVTGKWAYAIVEECTSLDFIIGNLFIGLVYSTLMYTSYRKRTIYVLASVVVAILANIIRTTSVVWITFHTDGRINLAYEHLTFGWFVFFAVVSLQLAVGTLFRDPPEPAAQTARAGAPDAGAGLVPVWMAAIAAMAAAPVYASLAFPQPHAPAGPLCFAPLPPGWTESAYTGDWHVRFEGATAQLYRTVAADSGSADLLVAYYWRQHGQAELISSDNRVYDRETWKFLARESVRLRVDGEDLTVTRERLRGPGSRRRLVWYWYWVDGRFVGSPRQARLAGAKATLLGGDPRAALIALSTEALPSAVGQAGVQALLGSAPSLAATLREVKPVTGACRGVSAP